jgi:soluble cytochrome b562
VDELNWTAQGAPHTAREFGALAKKPTRRLKVFQTQLGFYDSVVAAPSQAAALRAWGVKQNLFADGQARIIDEPKAVAAARAHPETPLRRAVGSADPFVLEPTGLPDIPDLPRPERAKARRAGKAARPTAPADRTALDAAEAALRKLDDDRERQEQKFHLQAKRLDDAREAARNANLAARKAATAAVEAARRAYRKAGGP